jgi:hypothetical protein
MRCVQDLDSLKVYFIPSKNWDYFIPSKDRDYSITKKSRMDEFHEYLYVALRILHTKALWRFV